MEPVAKRLRLSEAEEKARVIPTSSGPCIWWARNDLRLQDNPVLRCVTGAALSDNRKFAAVFCFDPRFLDRSPYGRVTDPEFNKSISTRKPINFSSRKTNALRARFWTQCVVKLGEDFAIDVLLIRAGTLWSMETKFQNLNPFQSRRNPNKVEQVEKLPRNTLSVAEMLPGH